MQGAGGAAEAAMGAVPGGMALRGARRAIATGAGAAGITGAGLLAGEAYAQDDIKRQKEAGNEKAGSGFFSQLGDLISSGSSRPMDRDAFMQSRKLGAPRSEGDLISQEQTKAQSDPRYQQFGPAGRKKLMDEAANRGRALYQSEVASFGDRQKSAEGEYQKYLDDQARLVNTGFKERAPDVAARLPMLGLAASAALPALFSGAKNVLSYRPGSKSSLLNAATSDAEAALLPTQATLSDAERRNLQLQTSILDETVKDATGAGAKVSKALGPVGTIGSGAAVGAEANMLPYQFDANALPDFIPGPDGTMVRNPKQQQAQSDAFDMSKWATKAAMNVPTAVTGYKIGNIIPSNTANIPRAQGVLNVAREEMKSPSVPSARPQAVPEDLLGATAPPPSSSLMPVRDFPSYGAMPPEARSQIQQAYIARAANGQSTPPKEMAAGIKQALAGSGVQAPVTPGRVDKTNQALQAFIAQVGRPPSTPAEWASIFGKSTLAIPAAIAGRDLMTGTDSY